MCAPSADIPARSHVIEAERRVPHVSTVENQFWLHPLGLEIDGPEPRAPIVVPCAIHPMRTVSSCDGPSTNRSTKPAKRSRERMSGDASGRCNGLSPDNAVLPGMNSPSSVIVCRGETARSTRRKEMTPVAPEAGLPREVVTPGTGTRSKLTSVDAKKCAAPARPLA